MTSLCHGTKPEGLITKKFRTRFRNLGIYLKISRFQERIQDFMKISRFHLRFQDFQKDYEDFQISAKISARFPDFNEDFCKISRFQ